MYLTPKELSARYKGRVTEKTLRNWRSKGVGPPFTKLGTKTILYALVDVERWEQERRSEPAQ